MDPDEPAFYVILDSTYPYPGPYLCWISIQKIPRILEFTNRAKYTRFTTKQEAGQFSECGKRALISRMRSILYCCTEL